jgi:hypothetical protein
MKRSVLILIVVIGIIGLIVVGAVGWYLASPLFIDNVVEEEFPIEVPGPAELAQMSNEELDKLRDQTMEAAAKMPDKMMDEARPESVADTQPVVLLQGQFMDADSFHQGSGEATIYQLPDNSYVLRFENFDVTNGPDLHVLLSSHPAPADRTEVGEDYVDLGSLKGNLGSQNYAIPPETDLSHFQSVVIYCLPFHVVFATATLG